jgi:HSP20 family protein
MVLVDDDFDEFFGVSDFLDSGFLRRLQKQMIRMMEDVKSGKVKGAWEVRRIDEPGMRGFFIQGRFGSDEALEPLEPLRPRRRRPLPETPFEVPARAGDEVREPLTDVFEEDDAMKVYVELPGVEKENISLKLVEDGLEIKAAHFYKTVRLPNVHIDAGKMTSEYKNGVLMVMIPKKRDLRWTDKGKARMV